MSKHGEILEIAIVPAGGRAKQVVQRALGKRRAHIRVHRICDTPDATAPMLVLIDGSALQGGESALAEVITLLQQSAWRDAPIVILDDSGADLRRGFAAGYAARIRLDSSPEAIAQLIEKMMHTAV
jgi:DNA-binding NarL/FixJ family response regulator